MFSFSSSPSRIVRVPGFRSTFLNNRRDILIYLPPGYDESEKTRYPTLYMHDGQHVFAGDESGESWEVHRTADRLIAEGKMRGIIVVAVSNIPSVRLHEYFHDHPGVRELFGPVANGEKYERFLIEEVKTYVDTAYRTLPDRAHTAILGSSAGGLVSYNIGFRRPDVFGSVGILSPFFVRTLLSGDSPGSFRMSETKLYSRYANKPPVRVWLDMGGAEGLLMDRHAREAADMLADQGFVEGEDLMYYLDDEAGHSQTDWAARIHAPLLYFFGEIGRPAAVSMKASHLVGIQGPPVRLNPVIRYDSGFLRSEMVGSFRAEPAGIVEVASDGLLTGLNPGTAKVIYSHDGLDASTSVTVIESLPEHVSVSVRVEVPDSTPEDARIYAGIETFRQPEGHYEGRAPLPRGLSFRFAVSRGFGWNERNADGSKPPLHSFQTDRDRELRYKVEDWGDPSPQG